MYILPPRGRFLHPTPVDGSYTPTPAGGSYIPTPAGGSYTPTPVDGSYTPTPADGSYSPHPVHFEPGVLGFLTETRRDASYINHRKKVNLTTGSVSVHIFARTGI